MAEYPSHEDVAAALGRDLPLLRPRPTREGRSGDSQRMPIPNQLPTIHNLLISDVKNRLVLGIERYGTPLQPFNGRDSLQDAYEEVLDLAVYLRQRLYEDEHPLASTAGDSVDATDRDPSVRPLDARDAQIGDDVHYVSAGDPSGKYPSTCRAAKIVELTENLGTVKLVVFNPTGIHFKDADYADAASPMTWHWAPA